MLCAFFSFFSPGLHKSTLRVFCSCQPRQEVRGTTARSHWGLGGCNSNARGVSAHTDTWFGLQTVTPSTHPPDPSRHFSHSQNQQNGGMPREAFGGRKSAQRVGRPSRAVPVPPCRWGLRAISGWLSSDPAYRAEPLTAGTLSRSPGFLLSTTVP